MKTYDISLIKKWSDKLDIPSEWRDEMYKCAENGTDDILMDNLLSSLQKCEEVSKLYAEKNISEKIMIDTLYDITVWAKNCLRENKKIGLAETGWTVNHLAMEIFRLGRLQYKFGKCGRDIPKYGLKEDSPIMEVHVPQNGSFDIDSIHSSFDKAAEFFDEYYPEYKYDYYICESWLFDFNMKNFLKPEANIIKFQNEFDVVSYHEDNSAVRRLFVLNENTGRSSLQNAVENHLKNGGKLYGGFAVKKK